MGNRLAAIPTAGSRLGWAILLLVSSLLLVNGVVWFCEGPDMALAYMESISGTPPTDLRLVYPAAADQITVDARNVPIWYTAGGALALMAATHGLRRGSRWAWYSMPS